MLATKPKKRYPTFERRITAIAVALILGFSLLGARLWYLQVIKGAYYKLMADQNSLRPQWLKAPRGMIYGVHNEVLVDNRPAYNLYLVPNDCGDDIEIVVRRLQRLLGIDGGELLARIEKNRSHPFTQIEVKRDITKSELIPVQEYAHLLPGVFTVVHPQRRYLYGKTAGQLMGFLGEVGPQELERDDSRYKMGDLIGRAGIEQMYEDVLRGDDGQMLITQYAMGVPQMRTDAYGKPRIVMDSYGHTLETFPSKEPVSGKDLHITLDIALQQRAEELLRGETGAICVLNAATGAVLALASAPGYNPGVFVASGTGEERARLLHAEQPNPMVSLAYRENYPPGSVFKVMLAAAALEEGLINEKTEFFCPGYYQLNNKGRKWNCWKKEGHGHMNVVEALAFSCDVFFYNVGLRLGPDRIHEWATQLGLGVQSGIDLPGEVSGLIPSQEWMVAKKSAQFPDRPWDHKWFPGDTLNVSIGQGDVATTPLQNAILMAAIVNGGHRVRPYLNTSLSPEVSPPLLSPSTLDIVQRGMRMCVEKEDFPSGTGRRAKVPGIIVLGKTGTAQAVGLQHYEDYESEEDIPYELRDHALFIAGVLDQDPPLAISVVVEHGLHGSSAAAPLAGELIRYFYQQRRPQRLAQTARTP